MLDTIAVGTLAGVVAVIAYEIVDWLITGSFGADYTAPWEAGANIYLNDDYIHTPFGYITGMTNSLLMTCAIGVLTAIALRISGKDFYLIKGIGISLMWRLGTFGILAPIVGVASQINNEPYSQFIFYINFIIVGAVTSYIVAKYMKPVVKR
ncbi:hypothetical protein [Desulfosporosinus sp.]|uniref:hypothetical protein n=1 Tax=Desulfosporosinus sp. TaxID=157907 RepID=UPI0025C2E6C8|nr:hypothetical protein [Desulfosporosinus sp.]MBC2725078.1 hypothetical protein [Desulfosporosinus sp.]